MGKSYEDISGREYRSDDGTVLTAIRRVGVDEKHDSIWLFKCKCGNFIETRKRSVTSGLTKSCGCFRAASSSRRLKERRRIATEADATVQMQTAQSIELKPWAPEDWPILYGWVNQYWNSVCTDDEPRNEDAFIELKRLQASPPGSITLGVYRDGRLGGLLLSVPVGSRVAQAHCFFRKGRTKDDSFFGPDVTVPALQMGMDFAFRVGYKRLDCVIFKHNIRMKRLLEAVGGVYEGTLRNRAWQHGEPIDMESWALFSPDNQPED